MKAEILTPKFTTNCDMVKFILHTRAGKEFLPGDTFEALESQLTYDSLRDIGVELCESEDHGMVGQYFVFSYEGDITKIFSIIQKTQKRLEKLYEEINT